mgnify:CR=1 FL=1
MLLCAAAWVTYAQTKVTESATVNGQDMLELKFDFADEIKIETWDKNEVYVEVSVSINDGEYDHDARGCKEDPGGSWCKGGWLRHSVALADEEEADAQADARSGRLHVRK